MSKSEYHFKLWRDRVKKALPHMVVKFYSQNHPYKVHMKIGQIIADINNPFFGVVYEGKRLRASDKLVFQMMLEIEVEEIFQKINTYE